MSNKVFIPSPQQSDFIQWCATTGAGNAILQAVAGAGKTTTILQACKRSINGSVSIAAFNKRIADEIKGKIVQLDLKEVSANTFHSLGYYSWRMVADRSCKVDGRKLNTLARGVVPENAEAFVVRLVSLAKQSGIGLHGTSIKDGRSFQEIVDHHNLTDLLSSDGEISPMLIDDCIDYAIKLLIKSNEVCSSLIDFDDMLYAPLMFNSTVRQTEWVFVDEAQDSNIVRRSFVKRMLSIGGRACFVGDERQAINGFAGADNDAMASIRREFNCIDMPLTISYRCPKLVVNEATKIVSHITAADTAPEGIVETIKYEEFIKQAFDNPAEAILCRNTAPLVAVAYSLIRRTIGCRVEGKDIGQGLIALINKWKASSLLALSNRLDAYSNKQITKLMGMGKEVAAANIQDRVESIKVLIEGLPPGSNVNDLRRVILSMFGDSNGDTRQELITLSTVHKSKGREWPTVYILGKSQFMPSKYARQDWQRLQEENLIYVAITRSFNKLVYVEDVPQRKKKNAE